MQPSSYIIKKPRDVTDSTREMVNRTPITLYGDRLLLDLSTYRGDHSIMHANVKSSCNTPETNMILYVSCISVKRKGKKKQHKKADPDAEGIKAATTGCRKSILYRLQPPQQLLQLPIKLFSASTGMGGVICFLFQYP